MKLPGHPHLRYSKAGLLEIDGVPLLELIETTGTPAYVYSASALQEAVKEMQRGLSGLDSLLCFAVKANSNIHLLRLLGELGVGMDLVSGGELARAEAAGIPGNRMVFSGVGKTPGEMARALELGIHSFNVESEPELALLSAVATYLGKTASVALRFNPDVDARTHPYISTGLKEDKFGLERTEILRLAQGIGAYSNVELTGISIHIGSQLTTLRPLDAAFGKLRSLVDELEQKHGAHIRFVDLGGGLGIRYRNEKPPTPSAYCRLIKKHFLRKKGQSPLQVILEPGRSLVGNAGVLVTDVLFRKKRGKKDFLVVDAAMNDLIRPALYQAFHEIIPLERGKGLGKRRKTDIVGPVCESADCFGSARMLSDRIESGDPLAILSAGAYGFSMASHYNSRPNPPEVLAEKGSFRVIRRRETYEDLMAAELPMSSPGDELRKDHRT